MRIPALTAVLSALLLAPLSAQQDWVVWDTHFGAQDGELSGYAHCGVGDLDGDGFDDYLLTSYGADVGGRNAGAFSVYTGQTGDVLFRVEGMASSMQLGYAAVGLGTHDGDGMGKVAVSAPFRAGQAGPFAGAVLIYGWDAQAGQAVLLQTLEGAQTGSLFGGSVAAFDDDGDGDLDLAVGSSGANLLDGRVSVFRVSSAGAALPAARIMDGAAGTTEQFGWAVAGAGDVNPGTAGAGAGRDDLIIGAPFASAPATESGAAYLAVDGGTPTALASPVGNFPDAHIGYSVAGGLDLAMDGVPDLVAGAPDDSAGRVLVWDGATRNFFDGIPGGQVGERFGHSVAVVSDISFDGAADVIGGSPDFGGGRGEFSVWSVFPTQQEQFEQRGAQGETSMLGWAVSVAGDVNQTGKNEVIASAPFTPDEDGRSTVFAPPLEDIGPIQLTVQGSFEWETDVQMLAQELSSAPADLYWYAGTALGSSTSPEGFDLDIAGNVFLINQETHNGSGSETQVFTVPDTLPGGSPLVFQVIEDRGGFTRKSNVDGGLVVDPGVTLFSDGGNVPGGTITLSTQWGKPNSPVYYYVSLAGVSQNPVNSVPNGDWLVNLINPIALPGFVQSNQDGDSMTNPITIPPSAAGRTVWFQAYDWDLFIPGDLTNVLVVQMQ